MKRIRKCSTLGPPRLLRTNRETETHRGSAAHPVTQPIDGRGRTVAQESEKPQNSDWSRARSLPGLLHLPARGLEQITTPPFPLL